MSEPRLRFNPTKWKDFRRRMKSIEDNYVNAHTDPRKYSRFYLYEANQYGLMIIGHIGRMKKVAGYTEFEEKWQSTQKKYGDLSKIARMDPSYFTDPEYYEAEYHSLIDTLYRLFTQFAKDSGVGAQEENEAPKAETVEVEQIIPAEEGLERMLNDMLQLEEDDGNIRIKGLGTIVEVIGITGSGKSNLFAAGSINALKREDLTIHDVSNQELVNLEDELSADQISRYKKISSVEEALLYVIGVLVDTPIEERQKLVFLLWWDEAQRQKGQTKDTAQNKESKMYSALLTLLRKLHVIFIRGRQTDTVPTSQEDYLAMIVEKDKEKPYEAQVEPMADDADEYYIEVPKMHRFYRSDQDFSWTTFNLDFAEMQEYLEYQTRNGKDDYDAMKKYLQMNRVKHDQELQEKVEKMDRLTGPAAKKKYRVLRCTECGHVWSSENLKRVEEIQCGRKSCNASGSVEVVEVRELTGDIIEDEKTWQELSKMAKDMDRNYKN